MLVERWGGGDGWGGEGRAGKAREERAKEGEGRDRVRRYIEGLIVENVAGKCCWQTIDKETKPNKSTKSKWSLVWKTGRPLD